MTSANLKGISDWFGSDFREIPIDQDAEKSAVLSMLLASLRLALVSATRAEILAVVVEALSDIGSAEPEIKSA